MCVCVVVTPGVSPVPAVSSGLPPWFSCVAPRTPSCPQCVAAHRNTAWAYATSRPPLPVWAVASYRVPLNHPTYAAIVLLAPTALVPALARLRLLVAHLPHWHILRQRRALTHPMAPVQCAWWCVYMGNVSHAKGLCCIAIMNTSCSKTHKSDLCTKVGDVSHCITSLT